MRRNVSAILIFGLLTFFVLSLSGYFNTNASVENIDPRVESEMAAASSAFDFKQQASSDTSQTIEWPVELHNVLDKVKRVRDMFNTEQYIVLEVTAESVLGQVNDVCFLDGYWFVIDTEGKQVWRFDEYGRFAGYIGQYGQGPGEYQMATKLERVYDNQLGVLDSFSGSIHVFTAEGQYVTSTPPRGPQTGGLYPYGKGFLWPQADTLIYSNILSFDADDPWHGVYKLSWPDAQVGSTPNMTLAYGFGEKFTYYHDAVRVVIDFPAFSQVDDQVWVGSPFSSMIEVYDREGRFIKTLEPSCAGCLSEETFLEKPHAYWQQNKYKHNLFTIKGRNLSIDQVGDVVFINHGLPGYTVYGRDGQLLATHHLKNDLGTIFDVVGNEVVTRAMLPSLDRMDETLRDQLQQAGYNFEDPDSHNDLLVVSSLKAFE